MPSRRRMLQMLGAVSAVGAGGWALLAGGRANAYYQGPASDHFDGVQFFNPGGVRPRGPGAFLKWQLGDRGEAWPKSFPSPFPQDRPPARFDGEGVRIVHVGHASLSHPDARARACSSTRSGRSGRAPSPLPGRSA